MRNHMQYIALLAIVLAPTLGCADRATAPVSIPRAQLARDPQALVPVDLGALGGLGVNRYSAALALSPTGDIVGWSTVPGPAYEVPHAVLWRDGAIIDLGTLGGHLSRAFGVNADGVIVGEALIPGDYFFHAVAWKGGVINDLGTLGGYGSIAYGINPSGLIVGWSQTPGQLGHACLWDGDTIIDLGTLGGPTSVAYAINPAGVIVGSSSTDAGDTHAFRWKNGVMTDLGTLGGANSVAYAVNPAGDVVGSSSTAGGEEHAVLWRKNGDMVDLGPPGRASVARGINASGQIVGYFSGSPSGGAFLWQNGVMTELPSVVLERPGEPAAPGIAHAYAISASGDIVGDGRTFLMPHAALWTR